MRREDILAEVKKGIPCTDYLKPAPNYKAHNQTGYCCPYCGSGTHRGRQSTGAVKFHSDTNTFYCHACDRSGDVIDAYRAATGSDYNTALSFLAERIGITIDSGTTAAQNFTDDRTERPQSDESRQKDKSHDETEKIAQNVDFSAYYKACADSMNDAAISYLTARGISAEMISLFNIGFDPAADPANVPGAMGNEYKPHPEPRVIIPCTNDFYIARSINPNAEYKAPNPKGTNARLFNTAALYNGAGVVFVCEGIFDALSFLKAGQAAIAYNSRGNGGLLKKQLEKRPTETEFIICHDNESDPENAAKTLKLAQDLNKDLQHMGYKSIVYNVAGKYHDANDALIADRTAFEEGIAAAIRELHHDELGNFLEKIQTEAYKPYKTELKFFDDLLSGGIIQQSLLLLMAAPGTGKTTLAQQLAETMAAQKKPVLYFNFEMSREQMLAKAISAKLYRNGGDKTAMQILQGYKWKDNEEERKKITAIIKEYRRSSFPYIKYNPEGSSSELATLLAYLQERGIEAQKKGEPAPAAIVDYLHLIKSRDGLDTQELIKQAVTGLKKYAVDYNTFVIGIIATNRASNKGGRLTMESGRDSSNLEYTGDYILSLNYEAIDSGKVKPDNVEKMAELQQAKRRAMILRVLKSRFSQPGKFEKIMFDAAHNIFYGTADDFIPPEGFILDDGAPAFDD